MCNLDLQGVDWINVAEGGDEWQLAVNTAMYLRISYKVGNFLPSWAYR
jgi:hypothetical protein